MVIVLSGKGAAYDSPTVLRASQTKVRDDGRGVDRPPATTDQTSERPVWGL
jgi:hypothetical protein